MLRATGKAVLIVIWQVAAAEPITLENGLETALSGVRSRYPGTDIDAEIVKVPASDIRNLKPVLPGLVYRSGASKSAPLPQRALVKLACEDFGTIFYHYGGSRPVTVTCPQTNNGLRHVPMKPTWHVSEMRDELSTIYHRIKTPDHRPVILQCWSGKHASGYSAAIVLRQFCGMGPEAAIRYWDRNSAGGTGLKGNRANELRQQIRDFVPIRDYAIDERERATICPDLRQYNSHADEALASPLSRPD